MTTRECVANRIVALCKDRNLAINALARISAVPPSTLKNIISGVSRNPGIVTIKMLCDGLGITLVEFFDTKENRNRYSIKVTPTFISIALFWSYGYLLMLYPIGLHCKVCDSRFTARKSVLFKLVPVDGHKTEVRELLEYARASQCNN